MSRIRVTQPYELQTDTQVALNRLATDCKFRNLTAEETARLMGQLIVDPIAQGKNPLDVYTAFNGATHENQFAGAPVHA